MVGKKHIYLNDIFKKYGNDKNRNVDIIADNSTTYDFEKMLKVIDGIDDNTKRGNIHFNLNESVFISFPEEVEKHKEAYFLTYIVTGPDPKYWTTLSYILYGTTRLYWLLMRFNNIKPNREALKPVGVGEFVYYLPKEQVTEIIVKLLEMRD